MEQRSLIALVLIFTLLTVYQVFMSVVYPPPPPETVAVGQQTPAEGQKEEAAPTPAAKQPPAPAAAQAAAPTANALPAVTAPQVTFKNDLITGVISTQGGRMVELGFLKHRDEMGEKGKPIAFLNRDPENYFFNESGFIAPVGVAMPDRRTPWKVAGGTSLQGEGSVTLTWDNGQGLTFEKVYTFDKASYIVTVQDRVRSHKSAQPVQIYHFAQLVRVQPQKPEDMAASYDFEGPMAYLDGQRVQHEYDAIRERDLHQDNKTGWTGFSDKYFLAAVMPKDQENSKRFYFDYETPAHRLGAVSPAIDLAPGTDKLVETRFFIGPKEIHTLEAMGNDLERAIDYGWFHFLALPLVELLLFFNKFFNNMGVAIILLTVVVKGLFFPLADKSYRSMNEMKKLQPKVEQLKKIHGDDKQRLNEEMMRLYQENKVNPLGGCLPIVVQIPVFFALYKVLYLSIEMRHTPFFGWIHDLSSLDPYYVMPLLMGASMLVQTRLNPAPADPVQAKLMYMLPIVFTVMFLQFPAGLVLYWLVNNVLSIAQQAYIMKQAK